MRTRARARLRRSAATLAALFTLALTLTACSSLAASTGTEEDRIVSAAHTQVQTAFLVTEAALEDPPAPAVTLTVILDDARSVLTGLRKDVATLPGDHGELMALVDESTALIGRTQGAVEDGDRQALREAQRHAEELASAFEERSETL